VDTSILRSKGEVVDLYIYAMDKKFFGCTPDKGVIWACNCGGELFWLSARGFQCHSCNETTLFEDWL